MKDAKDIAIKRLKRLVLAYQSFSEVIALCDHLRETGVTPYHTIYTSCVAGIVVTYMKPFVESEGMGPLPSEFCKFTDPLLQHTHNLLKESRHKLYAHRDVKAATSFKFDNVETPSPYEFEVEVTKGKPLKYLPQIPHLSPENGDAVKKLCVLQNERVGQGMDKILTPMIAGKEYKAGRYVLGENFP